MAALMIVFFTGLFLIDKYDSPEAPSPADWQTSLQQQSDEFRKILDNPKIDILPQEVTRFENGIKINEYRIEHDLNPYDSTLWSVVGMGAQFVLLVAIFTIIIAGDAVAGEFTWGTIKLLLIRPASRSKILLSKFTATLLYALLMLLLLFLTTFALGSVFEGFGGASSPDLYVGADGLVHERAMIFSVLKSYAFGCVDLLMMVTFAFMISAAFRSSLMAVGFGIGLLFAGSIIVQVLSRYSWVKYVLFANTNLDVYFGGVPLRPDMTLGFSVTVLLAYFVIFNAISWLLFTKRDVAV